MGFNSLDKVTSLPIVLNIADSSAISYVEQYTDPNPAQAGSSDNTASNAPGGASGGGSGGPGSNEGKSSNLSSGAFAGIAVGAGVGVSL